MKVIPFELGGDEEDRTPGLGIANAALSQLSYIPERIDSLDLGMENFKRRNILDSPFSIVSMLLHTSRQERSLRI